LFFLSSCWEKNYDYAYDIKIENATPDTLRLLIGQVNSTTITEPLYSIDLLPYETQNGNKSGLYGMKANEGINPIQLRFSNGWKGIDTVLVFHKDTLMCIWTAPAYGGSDSIHNFFNYNSWSYWIEKDPDGVMMFTIYPEDLKLNNE